MLDALVVRTPDAVVTVSGSVNLYTADRLFELLRFELLRPGCRSVAVDLERVSFLSFEGLRALLSAGETAERAGKRLRVHSAHDQPLYVLALSGVGQLLATPETVPATA